MSHWWFVTSSFGLLPILKSTGLGFSIKLKGIFQLWISIMLWVNSYFMPTQPTRIWKIFVALLTDVFFYVPEFCESFPTNITYQFWWYQIPAWSKVECNALSWDFRKTLVNTRNWAQKWFFSNIFFQCYISLAISELINRSSSINLIYYTFLRVVSIKSYSNFCKNFSFDFYL